MPKPTPPDPLATPPPRRPLPQAGGYYRRLPDGSLVPADAPEPEPAPVTPDHVTES